MLTLTNLMSGRPINCPLYLQSFIWRLVGLLCGPLCDVFGWRSISITGSVLCTISIISSAWVQTAVSFFVTFSIIGGNYKLLNGKKTFFYLFSFKLIKFKKILMIKIRIKLFSFQN